MHRKDNNIIIPSSKNAVFFDSNANFGYPHYQEKLQCDDQRRPHPPDNQEQEYCVPAAIQDTNCPLRNDAYHQNLADINSTHCEYDDREYNEKKSILPSKRRAIDEGHYIDKQKFCSTLNSHDQTNINYLNNYDSEISYFKAIDVLRRSVSPFINQSSCISPSLKFLISGSALPNHNDMGNLELNNISAKKYHPEKSLICSPLPAITMASNTFINAIPSSTSSIIRTASPLFQEFSTAVFDNSKKLFDKVKENQVNSRAKCNINKSFTVTRKEEISPYAPNTNLLTLTKNQSHNRIHQNKARKQMGLIENHQSYYPDRSSRSRIKESSRDICLSEKSSGRVDPNSPVLKHEEKRLNSFWQKWRIAQVDFFISNEYSKRNSNIETKSFKGWGSLLEGKENSHSEKGNDVFDDFELLCELDSDMSDEDAFNQKGIDNNPSFLSKHLVQGKINSRGKANQCEGEDVKKKILEHIFQNKQNKKYVSREKTDKQVDKCPEFYNISLRHVGLPQEIENNNRSFPVNAHLSERNSIKRNQDNQCEQIGDQDKYKYRVPTPYQNFATSNRILSLLSPSPCPSITSTLFDPIHDNSEDSLSPCPSPLPSPSPYLHQHHALDATYRLLIDDPSSTKDKASFGITNSKTKTQSKISRYYPNVSCIKSKKKLNNETKPEDTKDMIKNEESLPDNSETYLVDRNKGKTNSVPKCQTANISPIVDKMDAVDERNLSDETGRSEVHLKSDEESIEVKMKNTSSESQSKEHLTIEKKEIGKNADDPQESIDFLQKQVSSMETKIVEFDSLMTTEKGKLIRQLEHALATTKLHNASLQFEKDEMEVLLEKRKKSDEKVQRQRQKLSAKAAKLNLNDKDQVPVKQKIYRYQNGKNEQSVIDQTEEISQAEIDDKFKKMLEQEKADMVEVKLMRKKSDKGRSKKSKEVTMLKTNME